MIFKKRYLTILTISLLFVFTFQFSATYAKSESTSANANELAAVQAALDQISVLQPVEGIDSNVVTMVQEIVDESTEGVKVTITKSNHRQISKNGTITYGDSSSEGSVTFKLTKGKYSSSQNLSVLVPASIEASTLEAAKKALAGVSPLRPVEGQDSNVASMAQDIVDKSTEGVKVTITKSNHRQISKNGTITYGDSSFEGSVTFKLTKGKYSSSQNLSVLVPASIEASTLEAAKKALAGASSLHPVEGQDSNVASMAQDIVDEIDPGVKVSVAKSNNKQISKSGEITYGKTTVKGDVTFVLKIGKRSVNQSVSVIVPAKGASKPVDPKPVDPEPVEPQPVEPEPIVEPDPDAASVNAAVDGLKAVGTLKPNEENDTNIVDLAKSIVDKVSSGVRVEIERSDNPGISSTGKIVYSSVTANGGVTFKLSKNAAVSTLTVPVVVPAKKVDNMVDVRTFGAKGNGVTDDTQAIQKAIDYAYSKGLRNVYIPDGVYLVNPDISVRLKSNISLQLADNAVLKSKSSSEGYYNIVLVLEVSNVQIVGGKIIGDRYIHNGTEGEWGAGIGILGCSNVYVADMYIQDCWGDGIFVGDSWDYWPNHSENVVIERVICDNNRRQGISVISVKGLTVRDTILRNTNGTAPMSGIDLEPDSPDQYMLDVVLENIQSYNNGTAAAKRGGYGLDIWLGCGESDNPYAVPKEHVSIKVENFVAYGNYRGDASPNWYDYKKYGYNITGDII